MLFILGTSFEVDDDARGTSLGIYKRDDNTLEVTMEVHFKSNTVNWGIIDDEDDEEFEEEVDPAFHLNFFPTKFKTPQDLVGYSFQVDSLEEAYEREDSFYFGEHEPLEKYKLDVLAIEGDKAHIRCEGVAVTDGYADPYKTAEFKLDCWLPIRCF